MSTAEQTVQRELDRAIDTILDLLQRAQDEGTEIDPLATIVDRMKARGADLNLDEMPPVMRMLIGGMLG